MVGQDKYQVDHAGGRDLIFVLGNDKETRRGENITVITRFRSTLTNLSFNSAGVEGGTVLDSEGR